MSHNLADLPDQQREAIEREKRLWFRAFNWNKTLPRKTIVAHLEAMPEDEREDMRQRLNTVKARLARR